MDAGRFALDYEDESVDPCRFARTSIFAMAVSFWQKVSGSLLYGRV